MRRIAFVNEKGGTGKTTLAVHLAAWAAAEQGARVLLVDLDTQGHAGKSLGLDVRTLIPNAFHWLTDPAVPLPAVARPTAIARLSVVPAYKQLQDLAGALAGDRRPRHRLADRLEEASGAYDLVVLDGPPSLGPAVSNILVAATEVVLPVALTYLALDGCAEVARTVERVAREEEVAGLHISAVVPMLVRHTSLAAAILERLEAYFPGRVTPGLGFHVKIDEAQSHGKTVWEHAPGSRAAEAMRTVVEAIWERGVRPERSTHAELL
ncbi:MAG TPA: ParA family protein [Myxococcaceae bacterium]|nr:ParA family protein [Myxococcaceae bacterium]